MNLPRLTPTPSGTGRGHNELWFLRFRCYLKITTEDTSDDPPNRLPFYSHRVFNDLYTLKLIF